MRPYLAILSANFRTQLQYRAAAIAGMGTQLFWGLILVMVYQAFYRSLPGAQPLTSAEVVTYIWLGQAFFGLFPWGDTELRGMIRSGGVAYELQKPLDLFNLWYVRAVARIIARTSLRAIPMIPIAFLFFGLRPPASVASAALFALAMGGAILLSCALATLINITMLWTVVADGVNGLLNPAVFIFSGSIVPLPFFPAWAQTIMHILPFRGLVDTPYRLYLGDIPPADAAFFIGHQLAWALALILLGRWLLSRGLRRLVVQGG